MNNFIKIGTRDSKLALWQANCVKEALEKHNCKIKIVKIKSEGDLNTNTPLYEFGVSGIFTKTLDIALLKGKIDIAVHSFKDVPTTPADGIKIGCVLKRESALDVLMLRREGIDYSQNLKIATSSIRRKCQWLYKYPNHKIEPLRGNIDTRIKKLMTSKWDGAIFAHAGLKRLKIDSYHIIKLDWMIPSAAQGTIAVATNKKDKNMDGILKKINCPRTFHSVNQEREFVRLTRGGCSKPISANANYKNDKIVLKVGICSLDGKKSIVDKSTYNINDQNAGFKSYNKIKKLGGLKILK